MRDFSNSDQIERALGLVGELLEAGGLRFHVVAIGGSALNLLGVVSRATTDFDILAFADPDPTGALLLRPPDEPLPLPLADAARTVAADLGLDPHWLNTGPASQWRTGLPPGLTKRLHWRRFGGLVVGLADRYDLIFFKLYAAADDIGPGSVHFQDLVALAPTSDELEAAGHWVRAQDPGPDFAQVVSKGIEHVRTDRDRTR
jgi:hypothetical protein